MTTPTPTPIPKPTLGAGKPLTLGAGKPMTSIPAPMPVPTGDLSPALGGKGIAQFEDDGVRKPVRPSNPTKVPFSAEAVASLRSAAAAPFDLPCTTLPELEEHIPHQTYTLSGVSRGKPVFSTYPFTELQEGQQVWLCPDPMGALVKPETGHPDPYAISVQDKPEGGRHIGYIPNPKGKGSAFVVNNILKEFPDTVMRGRIKEVRTFTKSDGSIDHGCDVIVEFFEHPTAVTGVAA